MFNTINIYIYIHTCTPYPVKCFHEVWSLSHPGAHIMRRGEVGLPMRCFQMPSFLKVFQHVEACYHAGDTFPHWRSHLDMTSCGKMGQLCNSRGSGKMEEAHRSLVSWFFHRSSWVRQCCQQCFKAFSETGGFHMFSLCSHEIYGFVLFPCRSEKIWKG